MCNASGCHRDRHYLPKAYRFTKQYDPSHPKNKTHCESIVEALGSNESEKHIQVGHERVYHCLLERAHAGTLPRASALSRTTS